MQFTQSLSIFLLSTSLLITANAAVTPPKSNLKPVSSTPKKPAGTGSKELKNHNSEEGTCELSTQICHTGSGDYSCDVYEQCTVDGNSCEVVSISSPHSSKVANCH